MLSHLCPADELLCACDMQQCENTTCRGKVCFVSKVLDNGKTSEGKGCLRSNILEQCQTATTDQYAMNCCSSHMCNENISVHLRGRAQPFPPCPWGGWVEEAPLSGSLSQTPTPCLGEPSACLWRGRNSPEIKLRPLPANKQHQGPSGLAPSDQVPPSFGHQPILMCNMGPLEQPHSRAAPCTCLPVLS